MKLLIPLFVWSGIFCGSALGQAAPLAADTVIATIDGNKLTYGEIEGYLNALGPEKKATALASPRDLVRQYAIQKKLLAMAEKDKLDEVSPYKEALALSRSIVLIEAEMNYKTLHFVVTPEEQKKYYDAHSDRYTEVKLQALYLEFTSDAVAKENPKKYRNQAQTLALAKKIRAGIKTETDFIQAVAKYSNDESSKSRNGEFGVVKASDTVPPEDVKKIIFAMKPAEISEPILQLNGYYLFRAETVGLRSYADVKDDLYTEMKDQMGRAWMDDIQKNVDVKEENSPFFAAQPLPKK